MKKLIALILLFFLSSANHVAAQSSAAIEEAIVGCENGFRDFQSVRDNGRNPDIRGLIFLYSYCTQPLIYTKLNASQRAMIAHFENEISIERSKFSPKKIEETDRIVAQLIKELKRKDCPSANQTTASSEISRLWTEVCDAFQRNDVEAALRSFHKETRDKYRANFERMSKEDLSRVGADMKTITMVRIEEGQAIYELYRQDQGKMYSFQLTFMMDENCQWKVYSF